MNMDRIILVIVISAVIEAHVHNIISSRHAHSFKDKIDETEKAYDLKEAQLEHVHSLTPHLSSEKASVKTSDENSNEARVINVSVKGFEADDPRQRASSDDGGDLETDLSSSSESSEDVEDTKTRRQEILDYLKKLLEKKRENDDNKASKTNRRLDIEDNGDDFPGVVDIDDPRLIDGHQEEAENFRANRRILGYGTMLDMKGRSGEGSPVNTRAYPFYRPAMTGLFYTPGVYPFANAPTMPFTKINNGDLLQLNNQLQPMNVPFRGNSRRLEIDPRTKGNLNQNTYQVDLTLDPNSNAYLFEIEDKPNLV